MRKDWRHQMWLLFLWYSIYLVVICNWMRWNVGQWNFKKYRICFLLAGRLNNLRCSCTWKDTSVLILIKPLSWYRIATVENKKARINNQSQRLTRQLFNEPELSSIIIGAVADYSSDYYFVRRRSAPLIWMKPLRVSRFISYRVINECVRTTTIKLFNLA